MIKQLTFPLNCLDKQLTFQSMNPFTSNAPLCTHLPSFFSAIYPSFNLIIQTHIGSNDDIGDMEDGEAYYHPAMNVCFDEPINTVCSGSQFKATTKTRTIPINIELFKWTEMDRTENVKQIN